MLVTIFVIVICKQNDKMEGIIELFENNQYSKRINSEEDLKFFLQTNVVVYASFMNRSILKHDMQNKKQEIDTKIVLLVSV